MMAHDRNIGAAALIAGALLLSIALYLYAPVASVFSIYSGSFNEGWNAYHAARLLAGEPLYPSIETFIQNNYPPLSFYIAATVSMLTGGDMLIAGRLVALASLLITAGAIGLASAHALNSRIAGAIAGLAILGVIAGQYQIYVAYDDPQMLAHAFMACGVAALARSSLRPRDVAFASLFMLLGGFTKHMLIAAPLAATLWLFFLNKNLFRIWIIASIAIAGAAFLACFVLYGGEFFNSVLGYKRTLSPGLFLLGLGGFAPLLPIMLLGAFPLMVREAAGAPSRIFSIAMAFGILVALIARSGAGVDVNVYFDIVIYGVPAALAGVQSITQSMRGRQAARACGFLLGLLVLSPALSPAPMRLSGLFEWRRSHAAAVAVTEAIVERLRAIEGPVACERLSYCYWARKPFVFDFFNTDQAARADPALRRRAAAEFASGTFSALQLESDWRAVPLLFTEDIEAGYEPLWDYPDAAIIAVPR